MNGNAVSLGGVCIEWHISLATRNGDTNYQLVKGKRTTVVNEVGAYKDLSSFLSRLFAGSSEIPRADGKQMVMGQNQTCVMEIGRKHRARLWVRWQARVAD